METRIGVLFGGAIGTLAPNAETARLFKVTIKDIFIDEETALPSYVVRLLNP
jgi:hypothetical protein